MPIFAEYYCIDNNLLYQYYQCTFLLIVDKGNVT